MTPVIEKNVPIPQTSKAGRVRTLFLAMEPGDSVFMESSSVMTFRAAITRLKKQGYGFTNRKEGEGFRVWRVK